MYPGYDDESEGDPKQESPDGKEAAVVEEDARPSNDAGKETDGSGKSGEDELGPVPDTGDVGVFPDVEPGKQTKNEGEERISRELVGEWSDACRKNRLEDRNNVFQRRVPISTCSTGAASTVRPSRHRKDRRRHPATRPSTPLRS